MAPYITASKLKLLDAVEKPKKVQLEKVEVAHPQSGWSALPLPSVDMKTTLKMEKLRTQ